MKHPCLKRGRPAGRPACRGRGGSTMLLAVVAVIVLIGIASLCVDFGRAQLAKSEARGAAESAACAAAQSLRDGAAAARTAAAAAAAANFVDGTAVTLAPATDVEFGTWDPSARTFTTLSGSAEALANAVRVTVRRTSARGNALALPFASVVGRSAVDLVADATATLAPDSYGVVGLDYIKMGGNTTASYWSSGGGSASAASKFGNIASNGDITLGGSSYINGNARPGTANTVYGASGRVAGSVARLKKPLTFTSVDPSPYNQYNNDNGNLPTNCYSASGYTLSVPSNKTVTLAGGVYCLGGLTLDGTVTFAAPTTIYVWGPISIGGTVNTPSNLAKNLKIYTVAYNGAPPPGSVQITSGAALRAFIYAPQSPATFGGNGDFYGAIVAKSVDMTGTSAIYYDLAVSGNGGKSVIVR